MSISLVNVGALSENTSNSITPALPASMQTGDLMLVLLAAGGDAVTSTVSTPPGDGWAARGNELWFDYGAGGAFQVVYWKIHDGSESNPTFGMTCETGNGGGLWAATCAFRATAGFPADPFDLAAISQDDNAQASTSSYTPPSVEVQTTGATVISLLTTSDNNVISFGTSQGFTLSSLNYASTAGSDGSLTMAYKHDVSSGSVTMPTYSLSLGPDFVNHQTIAIKETGTPTVTGSASLPGVASIAGSGLQWALGSGTLPTVGSLSAAALQEALGTAGVDVAAALVAAGFVPVPAPFITRPFRRAPLRYAPLSGIPRRR